jgi:hypothetical protein
MLFPSSRPPMEMETVYCTYKTVRCHSPQYHILTLFFSVLLPGVSAGIMKYSKVIYTHRLQILIGSWLRLRCFHTHVSHHDEVTVSADLYGCEIWTAKEIDKKINWGHELLIWGEDIRLCKKCLKKRKNLELFCILFRIYMCFGTWTIWLHHFAVRSEIWNHVK